MFTGLVQQVGYLADVSFRGASGRIALSAQFGASLDIGESVAVNGTCLTLAAIDGTRFVFDVLKETFDKTALCDKKNGDPLNLERALRMGDPLGGHLVSGHVDGTGTLRRIDSVDRDRVLVVSAAELVPEMVRKGSVALDGVSLTLVDVSGERGEFSVHVIPHTWEHTSLSALGPGDRLNLETDMIGKYVRSYLARSAEREPATWDRLRDAGFVGT